MTGFREIEIKDFVQDIRDGYTCTQLMDKYGLSLPGLLDSFGKLIEFRALRYDELRDKFPLMPQQVTFVDNRSDTRDYTVQPILACDMDDAVSEGKVRNISAKGLQIEGITVKQGHVRNFLIMVEGLAAFSPFALRAECRWTRLEPETSNIVSGFKITEMSEKAQAELQKLLKSLRINSHENIPVEDYPTIHVSEDDSFLEVLKSQNVPQNSVSTSGSFNVLMQPAPFSQLLNSLPIPTMLLDSRYKIYDINDYCKMFGISREDHLGSEFLKLFPDLSRKVKLLLDEVFQNRTIVNFIDYMLLSQKKVPAKMGIRSIRAGDNRFLMVTLQDLTREMHLITVGKAKLDQLQKAYTDVVERLATSELLMQESREIMSFIMKTLEERIKEEKEKISLGIRFHLKPIIDRLKMEKLSEQGLSQIKMLDHLLEEILTISQFRVSRLYGKLSFKESEICDLIMAGYGTKEIAEIQSVSLETIATHRNRIRKKLSIPSDQSLYNFLRSRIERQPDSE